MGPGLAMRHPLMAAVAGLCLLALSACGNDGNAGLLGGLPIKMLAKAALGRQAAPAPAPTQAPDPATVAASRKMLEEAGTPLYIVQNPDLGLLAYFGQYGRNGDVETWATPDFTSISLRDGMVVATRGLGSDIMSAKAPATAEVAGGTGMTRRSYYYIDAADQTQRFDYGCILSDKGREKVTLIGKEYDLRRVDESCSGQQGSFVNSYWFEGEAKLRQSSQHLVPGIANLLLQRIID